MAIPLAIAIAFSSAIPTSTKRPRLAHFCLISPTNPRPIGVPAFKITDVSSVSSKLIRLSKTVVSPSLLTIFGEPSSTLNGPPACQLSRFSSAYFRPLPLIVWMWTTIG